MRDYENYRFPRTMNEAFGPYAEIDEETPHWFEVVWYVIKSILSGLGFISALFLIGYLSIK